MKTISIVIPVYNEAANLAWHHKSIQQVLKAQKNYKYEIVYVNDGSADNSLEILQEIAKADSTVRIINFSRNFGKEAATTAGLHNATGSAVLMIDADGQHPIELLPEFIDRWELGYEVVIGVRRINRGEGLIKRFGSKAFYKILNSFTEGHTVPNSTDFRLIDGKVLAEFKKLTEHNRITRGLIDWLGFKRAEVEFEANARHGGKATYSVNRLIRLALNAFVSQSTKPLQLTGIIGWFVIAGSSVLGLILLVEMYVLGDPLNLSITGTAFLGLLLSFLVGLVLMGQWLLALYIESIHNETQNRPLYIIKDMD